MRINVAIPEAHVSKPVLDAALEATTRLNEQLIHGQEIPTFERALKHGVRWKPERPGAEHFDHGATVLKRLAGDCDDLAPWHAASLRHTGEDKGARAVVRKSGPKRWHAVVQRSDGSFDDPSVRAGMHEWRPGDGVVGAAVPLMFVPETVSGAYILRPQLALRPLRNDLETWQARADIPWHPSQLYPGDAAPSKGQLAMATLHSAPVAASALTGCIGYALDLADLNGYGDAEHLERLEAVADALDGVDFYDLEGEYGFETAEAASAVVGSFFSGLLNTVKKAVPFVSKAVQFVPGVGPVASSALDIAAKQLPGAVQHLRTTPVALRAPVPHHGHSGRICFPATFE